MMRRIATSVLLVAGALLILLGIQRWLDYRSARQVVLDFVTALNEGDRENVLSLLEPEQRSQFELRVEGKQEDFWAADPDVTFRIHHIDLDGDKATAQVWIEKQGFVVKPILHLQRNDLESWKVRLIDNLTIDPLWEDKQYEQKRQEGEALAEELRKAFADRPDVEIQRVKRPHHGVEEPAAEEQKTADE